MTTGATPGRSGREAESPEGETMPQVCTVCRSPDRGAIDELLVGAKASFRDIAARFFVSTGALQRHKEKHVPAALAKAVEAGEAARADSLLDQVRVLQARSSRLWTEAETILEQAKGAADLRLALMAIREASAVNRDARGHVELLAKLLGELQDGPVINIYASAEWIQIQTVIVAALEPFPTAHLAVVDALARLDDADAA